MFVQTVKYIHIDIEVFASLYCCFHFYQKVCDVNNFLIDFRDQQGSCSEDDASQEEGTNQHPLLPFLIHQTQNNLPPYTHHKILLPTP
jgi:hypothetical protein